MWAEDLSLYWFEFSSDQFLCQVAIGVGPVCQSGDAFEESFQDGDSGVNGCPVFAEDFEYSLGSGTVSGNKSGFSCFEWFHLYWFSALLTLIENFSFLSCLLGMVPFMFYKHFVVVFWI